MASTQVAKWGNSLAVRIPKGMAEDARLREGDPVTLKVANEGGLVIKPARRKYKLQKLVGRITRRNCHEETDWGEPVGKEIW